MAKHPQLLDQFGRPIDRSALTEEIAAPTVGGVRSPMTGYPADGLTPLRLTQILRAADMGDPVGYMELAEAIEERDPHYLGVLGTRRRSVSQLDINVKPGGESPTDKKIAARLETWVERQELKGELFDILDAIGRGYSFTEIIWDSSEGQWEPLRLEYRDPRWFRFDRTDLSTPLQLTENGQEIPLPGFKFIFARIKAKSGIPLRSGLARAAMWPYLFKKFTERDWAIFTQTYGQPLRIGKFGPGASKEDRATLMRAISNIAGDCAAMIPEGMMIEFITSQNMGASMDLYERRADWIDKQVSKLVLGQTATTDAETGGLGSGEEHREVQEDIETADAGDLSAILNRDLIRPWVDLEFGPQKSYPTVTIGRPEAEDLAAFSSAISPLLAAGLKVKASEVRGKFALSEPEAGDEILGGSAVNPSKTPPQTPSASPVEDVAASQGKFEYHLNTLWPNSGTLAALQAQRPSEGRFEAPPPSALLAHKLDQTAGPMIEAMLARVEAMLETATDLDELRELLRTGFPELDSSELAALFAQAMLAAESGGRAMVAQDADV